MKYYVAMLENGTLKDVFNLDGTSCTGQDKMDIFNADTLNALHKFANRDFYFVAEEELKAKDFLYDWIEIIELLEADGVYIAINPHGFVLLVNKSDGIYIYSIEGDEGIKYRKADDNVDDFITRNHLEDDKNIDNIKIYLHSFYDLYS